MASTEITTTTTTNDFRETAPEIADGVLSPPPRSCFGVDFTLRWLLLACSIAALVVLGISDQTKEFPTGLPPPAPAYVSRDVKFSHFPAFIYLLSALAVTCVYTVITLLASACVICSPSPLRKLLFILILFDALIAGIMASAMGSAVGVTYIGVKGNSHVGWAKICNKFGKFCGHIATSAALSLAASIILVVLVVLSSFSMYRRSR